MNTHATRAWYRSQTATLVQERMRANAAYRHATTPIQRADAVRKLRLLEARYQAVAKLHYA